MIKKKKKKIKEISNFYAFRRHPTLPFWNKKAFLSLALSLVLRSNKKVFHLLASRLEHPIEFESEIFGSSGGQLDLKKILRWKKHKNWNGDQFFLSFFSSSISISLAILAPIQNDENEEREKWKKGKRNDPYRNHFLHPASRENLIKNCCL